MELGTIATAWGVAGIVSKVYGLLCGCAGFVLLATAVVEPHRPSAILSALFGWSDLPSSGPHAVGAWLQERGDVVTAVVQSVVVVALVWSALEVHGRPNAFADIRGPQTAWLGALVIAEAGGPGELGSFLVRVSVTALVLVAGEGLIHLGRRKLARQPGEWALAPAMGALVMGLALVLFLPVIALASATGGRAGA